MSLSKLLMMIKECGSERVSLTGQECNFIEPLYLCCYFRVRQRKVVWEAHSPLSSVSEFIISIGATAEHDALGLADLSGQPIL